ncbi:MAG: response regulator transcription factor, partial [Candidatus Kapaibacterium sp.]
MKNYKVLVIEDEDLVREGIVLILQVNGYDVYTANNGRKGVDEAKRVIPDLIISDVMMPELDGYGVLEQLRATKETSTIPFLFLTAKADKSDIRQGMNLGADDYLTKPFEIDELIEAVNARLQRASAEKSNAEEIANVKLNELRTNLTFSLPHEFLTPLNGILGLSNIMMNNLEVFSQEEA